MLSYSTVRNDRFTGKEARSKEVIVSIPQHSKPSTQTLATITSITKVQPIVLLKTTWLSLPWDMLNYPPALITIPITGVPHAQILIG